MEIFLYKDLADKTPEQVQEILQALAKSQVSSGFLLELL